MDVFFIGVRFLKKIKKLKINKAFLFSEEDKKINVYFYITCLFLVAFSSNLASCKIHKKFFFLILLDVIKLISFNLIIAREWVFTILIGVSPFFKKIK